MEPTTRQRRFVFAAYKAAPKKADRFQIEDVGATLGYSVEEARDIARILERDFQYVTRVGLMPDDPLWKTGIKSGKVMYAVLTDTGRECARQAIDDTPNIVTRGFHLTKKTILVMIAVVGGIAALLANWQTIRAYFQTTPTTQPATP
jgi:hypothetical protein